MTVKLFPKDVKSIFDKSTPEHVLRSLDNDTIVRALVEIQKNYIQLNMMKNSGNLNVLQTIGYTEKLLSIVVDEIENRIRIDRKSIEPILLKNFFCIEGA